MLDNGEFTTEERVILAEIKKEQTPKLDATDIGMYGSE